MTCSNDLPAFWRAFAKRRLPVLRAQFGKNAQAFLDLELQARRQAAAVAGDEAAAEAEIAFQRAPNGRGVRVAMAFDPALIPAERQAAAEAAERLSEGLGPFAGRA